MKRRWKIFIFAEIIVLCAAAFGAFRIYSIRAEERARKEAAEEAAERAAQMAAEEAERRSAKEAERERRLEERNQWNLILVNPENAIPDDYEVETAGTRDGQEVDARIRDSLEDMLADCEEAGGTPYICSAFRTRQTQEYLYDHAVNKNDTALPGHSEHECGLAVDVVERESLSWSDPLVDRQEETKTQMWLMEHCADYGFILRYPRNKEDITGIIYEPWHYRYVGEKYAKDIMGNGLCLEEYLEEEF